MNAVLCTYNDSILGMDNKMPWEIFPQLKDEITVKEDLKIFKHLTKDSIVVMGRKTWESFNFKPLTERKLNIVITSDPQKMAQEHPLYRYKTPVNYLTKEEFEKYYMCKQNVWIIGGLSLYKEYIPKCEQVYVNNISVNKNFVDFNKENLQITTALELRPILFDNNFKQVNMYSNIPADSRYTENTCLTSSVYFKDYRL